MHSRFVSLGEARAELKASRAMTPRLRCTLLAHGPPQSLDGGGDTAEREEGTRVGLDELGDVLRAAAAN